MKTFHEGVATLYINGQRVPIHEGTFSLDEAHPSETGLQTMEVTPSMFSASWTVQLQGDTTHFFEDIFEGIFERTISELCASAARFRSAHARFTWGALHAYVREYAVMARIARHMRERAAKLEDWDTFPERDASSMLHECSTLDWSGKGNEYPIENVQNAIAGAHVFDSYKLDLGDLERIRWEQVAARPRAWAAHRHREESPLREFVYDDTRGHWHVPPMETRP